jgi:hypothetical protein
VKCIGGALALHIKRKGKYRSQPPTFFLKVIRVILKRRCVLGLNSECSEIPRSGVKSKKWHQSLLLISPCCHCL